MRYVARITHDHLVKDGMNLVRSFCGYPEYKNVPNNSTSQGMRAQDFRHRRLWYGYLSISRGGVEEMVQNS